MEEREKKYLYEKKKKELDFSLHEMENHIFSNLREDVLTDISNYFSERVSSRMDKNQVSLWREMMRMDHSSVEMDPTKAEMSIRIRTYTELMETLRVCAQELGSYLFGKYFEKPFVHSLVKFLSVDSETLEAYYPISEKYFVSQIEFSVITKAQPLAEHDVSLPTRLASEQRINIEGLMNNMGLNADYWPSLDPTIDDKAPVTASRRGLPLTFSFQGTGSNTDDESDGDENGELLEKSMQQNPVTNPRMNGGGMTKNDQLTGNNGTSNIGETGSVNKILNTSRTASNRTLQNTSNNNKNNDKGNSSNQPSPRNGFAVRMHG
ncbi:hypothetical protein ABK040_005728 [Willaertia magna]